jgi:prepilin-type processing-associated H-X9-DG protein
MLRNRAFTILELLVVTTIVVMLSAILFPVFSQAKESAKGATCFSNIRQAAFATTLYCDDYDDTFPSGFTIVVPPGPDFNSYDAIFWWGGFHVVFDWSTEYVSYTYHPEWGFIYPYTRNTAIQACPSTPYIESGYSWMIGYGYNPILLTSSFPEMKPKVKVAQVERPAETVLYGDAASPDCTNEEGCSLYVPNQINPPSGFMSVHGRHRGRANAGFADGHAKSMPVSLRPLEFLPKYLRADPEVYLDYDAKEHIGDLLNPRYPYGNRYEAYYFTLDKPE